VECDRYRAVANLLVEGLSLYIGKEYTRAELEPSLGDLLSAGCVVCTTPDTELNGDNFKQSVATLI
jgi:hypothetical protein